MGFELRVVRNNPLTGENNLDEALRTFLKQIGYIPESAEDEIPYRMMRDCFLSFPGKPWTIDELLDQLDSSKSTLYRYLNKLKGLDLLEERLCALDRRSGDLAILRCRIFFQSDLREVRR